MSHHNYGTAKYGTHTVSDIECPLSLRGKVSQDICGKTSLKALVGTVCNHASLLDGVCNNAVHGHDVFA